MNVILSARLQALAEMVTPGKRVVDVGCDHGFLPIYLVQNKISPWVLAMDVRKGPLAGAQEHIAECGLENYIETRLSDGLTAYRAGEAGTMVCAGMGGRLMQKILTQDAEKVRDFSELILQPQSEIPAFRRFLQSEGYEISDENILFEEGKFYFLIKAAYTGKRRLVKEPLYDKYGKKLLTEKHPVLKEYLQSRMKTALQIEEALISNGQERARERLEEVRRELDGLEQALAFFEG